MDYKCRIEPMTESMVDEVYAIERTSFSQPWSKAALTEEARGVAGAHYLVACIGDRIVGYGGFRQVLDEAHITNIAVEREYRGQGIGRVIMEGLLNLCPSLGILYITLEVRHSNKAALSLYRRCGFAEAGTRPGYYEKPREDAVIMWKTLV